MKSKFLMIAFVLSFVPTVGFTSYLNADIVYNNLEQTDLFDSSRNIGATIGGQFNTRQGPAFTVQQHYRLEKVYAPFAFFSGENELTLSLFTTGQDGMPNQLVSSSTIFDLPGNQQIIPVSEFSFEDEPLMLAGQEYALIANTISQHESLFAWWRNRLGDVGPKLATLNNGDWFRVPNDGMLAFRAVGSVASVPEPNSFTLFFAASCALLTMRRNRHPVNNRAIAKNRS